MESADEGMTEAEARETIVKLERRYAGRSMDNVDFADWNRAKGVLSGVAHERKRAEKFLDPHDLAERFHEAYERLAPTFSYETRPESRVLNRDTANYRLMVAVCAEVFKAYRTSGAGEEQ